MPVSRSQVATATGLTIAAPSPSSAGSGASRHSSLPGSMKVSWRIARPYRAGLASRDGCLYRLRSVSTFDRLAELPIEIEGYELEDRDRTYGEFTRPSTIIHMRGGGLE